MATVEAALKDGDATAVPTAVDHVKQIGNTAGLASLLLQGLSNDKVDVRETCSQQLVNMAPDNQEVDDALMETGLKDQDSVVGKHAAEALGRIGPAAKVAVPALDQLQRNPVEEDDVRKAASLALEQINKESESPAEAQ